MFNRLKTALVLRVKPLFILVLNVLFPGHKAKSSILGMSDGLRKYIINISVHEPRVLTDLRIETSKDKMRFMQIPPEQGQFLYFLVKAVRARKALELGVYTGYSSIWIAYGLPPDGKLVACDINLHWISVARKYWHISGVNNKIDFRLETADRTLRQLLEEGHAGTFDFIFIDADKENYISYYESCLELLSSGGIMVIDNVLKMGNVANPRIKDIGTDTVRRLNEIIYNNPAIDISVIPMADGITLIRKKGGG